MLNSCGAATAGDSACSIPPQTIPAECLEVIRDWTTKLAKELKVVGLINIQYCIQDNQVIVLCYHLCHDTKIHVDRPSLFKCIQAAVFPRHLNNLFTLIQLCTPLCFRRRGLTFYNAVEVVVHHLSH